MIKSDFHVHTIFCDGRDKPEDIILRAISLGMNKIGFSGHSYTPFDEEPCMSPDSTEKCKLEINRLKREYKSKIEIFCGIEQDYYSDMPVNDYDFVIGSVHYINCNGEFQHVDSSPEKLARLIHDLGDDVYLLAEKYFSLVSDVVNKTQASIIGHFDLITKFNENNKIFDVNNPRYVKAAFSAVDSLIKTGRPFEINTGAISRGYRTSPYPDKKILEYIAEKGGKVILSSDSHSKETLLFKFDECEKLAKSLNLEVVTL